MAETGRLTGTSARALPGFGPVTLLRVALIAGLVLIWELLSASGWFYRDVVPSWTAIGGAIWEMLTTRPMVCNAEIAVGPWQLRWELRMPEFYCHLGRTVREIGLALLIGGVLGLVVGLALGANRFLSRAFEPMLYYLGPTPKIIFFPLMIMWFGLGPGSKIAMGAISCFFPIVLSAAAGVREIDHVLIRVGKSFRANAWQTATKIYLPAIRPALINGLRLGLGIALIGTLLAETKLSNFGIGYLIIQAYSLFDMPRMYASLILLFVIAIGANSLIGRFGRVAAIQRL
jgi:ABC-type nitrate/sulfonate/bicarbonate transport system permease component